MSKVLLHLEITFAVINKIPSHSFGAYDWVSWIYIYIRIFFLSLTFRLTLCHVEPHTLFLPSSTIYCMFQAGKTYIT